MKYYKTISLLLSITFGIVGLIFLFYSNSVLRFFNSVSETFGMAQAPETGLNFYLILAVGYMYLVTLIAFFMYRFPENRFFPLILGNGKIASSVLSLGFFMFLNKYLIYLINFVVDGLIGILAFILYFKLKQNIK